MKLLFKKANTYIYIRNRDSEQFPNKGKETIGPHIQKLKHRYNVNKIKNLTHLTLKHWKNAPSVDHFSYIDVRMLTAHC